MSQGTLYLAAQEGQLSPNFLGCCWVFFYSTPPFGSCLKNRASLHRKDLHMKLYKLLALFVLNNIQSSFFFFRAKCINLLEAL